MNDNEIIEKLSEVFKNVMEVNEFNMNMDMNKIFSWDSLKHISFIVEMEKKFNIQFNYNDITEMTSINKIFLILKKYLN